MVNNFIIDIVDDLKSNNKLSATSNTSFDTLSGFHIAPNTVLKLQESITKTNGKIAIHSDAMLRF